MSVERQPARQRVFVIVAAVIGALVTAFMALAGLWTDKLWFDSIDFGGVFSTTLLTKALLFLVAGGITTAAIWTSATIAYRGRPMFAPTTPEAEALDRYRTAFEPIRRLATLGGALVFGLLAGQGASSQWQTFLMWRNASDFGVVDPQFGLDVGFFAFTLPWLQTVVGLLSSATVLAGMAGAAIHYVYGGLRPQAGERTSPAARVHLSVLAGIWLLLRAANLWLDRYALATKEGSLVTGMKYTDVNAILPGTTTLAGIAVVCALLLFANAIRRNWTLAGLGAALMVLSSILIGGMWPALVQQLQVKPNEQVKEAPFITRNIASTRAAFGIDKVKVEPYAAVDAVDEKAVARDRAALEGIRLLDPTIAGPTFQQLQQIKGFYSFADALDVSRLFIDGAYRSSIVAVREVNLEGIPETQRNWVTSTLIYTHGIGLVAARDNAVSRDGEPSFIESDVPPTGALQIKEPRVYFGEQSPLYSIVGAQPGAKPRELDYPDDTQANGQQNNTYTGKGGVPIGSILNRLLFAARFSEQNILLSNEISSESRILFIREPKERVAKVAPWLTIDSDAYPVVLDGRIVWVLDGYTTSSRYPYAQLTRLADAVNDAVTTPSLDMNRSINYIRNSVKATVDAYDGTVRLYAWDEQDPVLKTWRAAFPDTVKPKSAIPAELLPQLRYPEDLFKVQRDVLKRYHITDAAAFFSGENFWIIPEDPTRTAGTQPPFYLNMQLPGTTRPVFSLTTTFAPAKRPSLAAIMAVNSEPGPDYGKLRVLQLPSQTTIPGPVQAQNNFESDAAVASELSLLRRGGSDVVLGNLLSLPIAGGVLYVEPVYVQAAGVSGYPLLRKVIVSFGQQVVMRDTLDQALRAVIGIGAAAAATDPDTGTSTETPTSARDRLAAALAEASAAYAEGEAALKNGDFTAYGNAQRKLLAAIKRAQTAQGQLGN